MNDLNANLVREHVRAIVERAQRERGLSLNRIAKRADLAPNTLRRYLNGYSDTLNFRTAAKLAPVLGVTVAHLTMQTPPADTETYSEVSEADRVNLQLVAQRLANIEQLLREQTAAMNRLAASLEERMARERANRQA